MATPNATHIHLNCNFFLILFVFSLVQGLDSEKKERIQPNATNIFEVKVVENHEALTEVRKKGKKFKNRDTFLEVLTTGSHQEEEAFKKGHTALAQAREKGKNLRRSRMVKHDKDVLPANAVKESSMTQVRDPSVSLLKKMTTQNLTTFVREELMVNKLTVEPVSLEAKATARTKQKMRQKSGASAMYGLRCFDFDKYTAGTIINADDTDSALFANGDITIRLNPEAGSKATLGVIKEGELPFAYQDSKGDINACLGHLGEASSGLAILPRDRSLWNMSSFHESSKTRKGITKELSEIIFSFENVPTPITYFEVTFADLGDWNALKAVDTSAVAILIALDANQNEVDRSEFRPHILGDGSYDACKPNATVSVSVDDMCTFGGLDSCIHAVKVQFESVMTTGPRKGQVHNRAWDPNFSFGQICWPGAAVINDPHFTGFDGSTFDFSGHPDHIFNLISDAAFQMNSKFIEGPDRRTYMGELGFLVGVNQILVAPDKVLLNHKSVAAGQYLLKNMKNMAVGVLLIRGKDSVSVHTDAFNIDITTERWDDSNIHLNFHSSVRSQFLTNPHGVLGQTAQYLIRGFNPSPVHLKHNNPDAAGFLEGTAVDYLVSDGILGTRSTFNRYGIAADRTVDGTRRNEHAIARSSKRLGTN